MMQRILVVDDEVNMRWVLKEALVEAGYEMMVAANGQEALSQMSKDPADLVILDLKMKGMDGLGTLARLRERWPDTVVIILTAHGTVATAVEAMQLGAVDYLRKPFDVEEIAFKIQRALERKALHAEVRRLRHAQVSQPELVGSHALWQRCVEQTHMLTSFDADILFHGQPGVGKTSLAHLAHRLSQHSEAPLIEFDCRILVDAPHLAERLSLNHPDAVWVRAGNGTLLLRHAACLPNDAWDIIADAIRRRTRGPRLLLTTTTSLGLPFTVAEINVPALADHRSDIPIILSALYPSARLTPAAMHLLEHYAWPGNLTELKHLMDRAIVLAHDTLIDHGHFPATIHNSLVSNSNLIQLPPEGINLEDVEIALIRQALTLSNRNKTRAAELLGLTRHTLLYRLEKYGLENER